MPKPQWLKDKEAQAQRVTVEPDTCINCIYLGRPIKIVKHKGEEWTEVYECDIHPGCFNTKFSIVCDDFCQ